MQVPVAAKSYAPRLKYVVAKPRGCRPAEAPCKVTRGKKVPLRKVQTPRFRMVELHQELSSTKSQYSNHLLYIYIYQLSQHEVLKAPVQSRRAVETIGMSHVSRIIAPVSSPGCMMLPVHGTSQVKPQLPFFQLVCPLKW